jgi:hypothetical protein
MNADEIRDGMRVRVTTERQTAGHTWLGRTGVIAATFDRGHTEQWVYVRLDGDGYLLIGFAPEEIEPS